MSPINSYPAIGACMHQIFFVKYCNRRVYPIDNLAWLSGLAPHLIEQFGWAQQGSKVNGLTLNSF